MAEKAVALTVELTVSEAWAMAQFLKRTGHSDYRRFAQDDEEAFQTLYASDKLRAALAEAGIAPR